MSFVNNKEAKNIEYKAVDSYDFKRVPEKCKEFAAKRYGRGIEGDYNTSPDLERKFLRW